MYKKTKPRSVMELLNKNLSERPTIKSQVDN